MMEGKTNVTRRGTVYCVRVPGRWEGMSSPYHQKIVVPGIKKRWPVIMDLIIPPDSLLLCDVLEKYGKIDRVGICDGFIEIYVKEKVAAFCVQLTQYG